MLAHDIIVFFSEAHTYAETVVFIQCATPHTFGFFQQYSTRTVACHGRGYVDAAAVQFL